MTNIKIVGLEELQKKALPDNLLYAAVRKLLTDAGKMVADEARKRAPRRTGRLKGSIDSTVDTAALPQFAKVGTPVFYARFQEYGTSRTSAQPFLKPAYESLRSRIDGMFRDAIRNIESVWGK